jgi:CBS domain-containing protein
VEEDGRLAGVVTALDILRWLARQHGLPVRNGPATRLEAV